jgi:hypothetical protein
VSASSHVLAQWDDNPEGSASSLEFDTFSITVSERTAGVWFGFGWMLDHRQLEATNIADAKREAVEIVRQKLSAILDVLPAVCDGCGNDIDPHTCHCGDGYHGWGEGGHGFTPMGCTCGFAKAAP